MDLPNDLISQFVKITNDEPKKVNETLTYGTTIEQSGQMYVILDGSDVLTPVETTATMRTGERVTVLIKNHIATVTGNISAPSTNENTVDQLVGEKVGEVNGVVSSLGADVTDIYSIINGNLSDDNIDSIDAGKINSGTINTNVVTIMSTDNALIINGSKQVFRDRNGNIRVEMGKGTNGEFSFVIYSQNKEAIINQNGITAAAISDGLIVNKMIGNNAAISSNKIRLEAQKESLEDAFNKLKAQVEALQQIIDGMDN